MYGGCLVQLECRRAGTRRERKDVQVCERQPFDEVVSLLKTRVALAGKADHHIRANCRLWKRRMDLLDLGRIMPGPVSPVHGSQNWVGPRLQRQMGMPG